MKVHFLVFGWAICLITGASAEVYPVGRPVAQSLAVMGDHIIPDTFPGRHQRCGADTLRSEERAKRREERKKWQEDAEVFRPHAQHVYKGAGRDAVRLFSWRPEDWTPGGNHAAILFIHGGRWSREDATGVYRICSWYSRQGMVAFAMEFSRNPADSQYIARGVVDSRNAFQWIRANAQELGVDTTRLFAGGNSSGGHLAATLATIRCPLPDLSCQDPYPVPAGLLLFNPAVELDSTLLKAAALPFPLLPLESLSPYHRIHRDHPPTLILHGTEDKDVPITYSRRYVKRLRKSGVRARLEEVSGAHHGFFKTSDHFESSMQRGLRFLRENR